MVVMVTMVTMVVVMVTMVVVMVVMVRNKQKSKGRERAAVISSHFPA